MEKIWLKSYPPGVPAEVDVDAVSSVGELFEASVRAHGDRRAFISGATGTAITYRELDRLSRDFAAYLQSVLKLPQGRPGRADDAEHPAIPRSPSSARCAPGTPSSTSIRCTRRASSRTSSRIRARTRSSSSRTSRTCWKRRSPRPG